MESTGVELTFGPVPSRRLGRSLGINNIPPKICSYACVYCQVGKTIKMQLKRSAFYTTEDLLQSVEKRLRHIREQGGTVDYLCFVPDGEPTLDRHLGRHIEALKPLGVPVAVISNGSLIDQIAVQNDLSEADWVSLKVDTVSESLWHKVDRPHPRLELNRILDGMRAFRSRFDGILATETMLIRDFNEEEQTIRATARFLAELHPQQAYLSIPTRPPADPAIHAAEPSSVNRAYQILRENLEHVEVLSGYEGNAFSHTGNAREDLLSITAVHPMRRDAVEALLEKENAGWDVVDALLRNKELIHTRYQDESYYLRRF